MAGAERATVSVVRDPLREIDGSALLVGLRSALAWLQANQEQVNELNVFPVPDGDTGSNMYLTLRAAVEDAQAAPVIASAGSVMKAAAHGSLMGARGNSGVILSQVFRGFAQAVGDRDRLDADAVASSLAEAARVAYKAVMKPTEGTILTVVREAAEAARRAAAESDDIRIVLEETVREAHAAVERTTDQLAVLRDAGVVDAGGFGLAIVLEGLTRALADTDGSASLPAVRRRRSGEPHLQAPTGAGNSAPGGAAAAPSRTARRRGAAAVAVREQGWGYCTEFMVSGPGLDVDALGKELGALGESALVVGDSDVARVHIHTHDPAGLISVASQRGRLSNLKVEDMTAQHHEVMARADQREAADAAFTPAAAAKPLGVVAVAPGDGFRDIFLSLGADVVVAGGQTMNPSIEDLLKGVRKVGAETVVILPNNPNVILTAEQVHGLAEGIEVKVSPSRSLPQGISAMLAIDPSGDVAGNLVRMAEALGRVSTVEITRAVRDSSAGGLRIRAGEVMALVDDDIVQTGEDELAVIEAVLRNHETPPELVTAYWGEQVDEAAATALVERLREAFPTTEFELHRGGQEHYPYILSLE
ncbi:MAG: DAK2 domain-containing protein [Candidatus Dormibacteria bacterium]